MRACGFASTISPRFGGRDCLRQSQRAHRDCAVTRGNPAALGANGAIPVVVDEAYVDFGGETAIPLIAEFRICLVVRTFSKSRALAGLRVGYALGDAGADRRFVAGKELLQFLSGRADCPGWGHCLGGG